MKDGILIASFGTTAPGAYQRTMGVLTREVRRRWPGAVVREAVTSPTVRRRLAERGEARPDVSAALRQLAAEGVDRAAVLAAFVMPGIEYHRLAEDCRQAAGELGEPAVSAPLLDCPADLFDTAAAVLERHPDLPPDTALVLMGHGTGHRGDFAYSALDSAFRELGHGNVFVATVEGAFGLESLARRLREHAPRRVILRPLLLVAGEHVQRDMAGEEAGSWRSRLAAAGYRVECIPEGLGELPGIRRLFLRRLEAACPYLTEAGQ